MTETPLHQQCDLWIVLWDPRGRGVCPSASLFPSLHRIPREHWCAVTSSWHVPTRLSDIWEDEYRRVVFAQAKFSFYWKADCLTGNNTPALASACLLISSCREGWSMWLLGRGRNKDSVGTGVVAVVINTFYGGVLFVEWSHNRHVLRSLQKCQGSGMAEKGGAEKGGRVLQGVGSYRAEQLSHIVLLAWLVQVKGEM